MEEKSGKLLIDPKTRFYCPRSAKIVFCLNIVFTIIAFIWRPALLGDELPLWVFLLIPMFLLPLYFGWRGVWWFLFNLFIVYGTAYGLGYLGVKFHALLEMFFLISGAFTYHFYLERYRQNYLYFFNTLAKSPNVVVIFDDKGNILYLNEKAWEVIGPEAEKYLNKNFYTLPQAVLVRLEAVRKALATGAPVMDETVKIKLNGKNYSFLVDVQFYDLPGKGRELFLIARDITRMTELEDKLRATVAELEGMVVKDPLTKLYNYSYLMEQLETSIKFAEKYENKVSLIILDLDEFARYNDAFGIKAGDELLCTIAEKLNALKPPSSFLARLGGDEFAFLVPGYNFEEAFIFAEKVQKLLSETDFPGKEVFPRGVISASIGIVLYPDNGTTAEELMSRAKDALYQAKQYGKNNAKIYFSILEELSRKGNIVKEEIIVSLKTIISIINSRDKYTYGHTERVAEYAEMLALELGLSQEMVEEIKLGAFFHDLGKLEIPREVLRKKTPLTEEEWQLLKQHPVFGVELIQPLKIYDKYLPYILHHHERYDGKGYPAGLKGEEIPLGVRILTLADSFDAMTTDRPYKKGKTLLEAVEELRRCAGTQFDPELTEVFIKYLKRERLDNNARQIN
ncbi:HD domain-containing phosphohydrolase [Carboxydothermus pertinax]|uniref:HDIG domain-containing protein n=1 Tax=Carboxydothermus pertinax TaxID=870242 RepID=A0A1L8CTX7_9THEO|nr:HD domain-containing phosphohydrolase [Carboxydothermus pertinax]GAV22385.1 HDIG domain-containing protein [Carboxydothermus pertinax]